MAKVKRTKTHVKIYLTPLEVSAFVGMILSANETSGGDNDDWACQRVADICEDAKVARNQILKQRRK